MQCAFAGTHYFYVIGNCDRLASVNQEAKLLAMCVRRNALFLLGEIMVVFCTDLDNTIIYSYKHDIGERKRNVELYQGREISFITEKTFDLLSEVKRNMLIIPTSTRTKEQYERIDLGVGEFEYALVCNGGLLLKKGEVDMEWYNESLKLVDESSDAIKKSLFMLEKDDRRKFELRFIERLFVFTKCNNPEVVVNELKQQLDCSKVNVFNNGEKVYVVPVSLSKGMALKRLRNLLNIDYIIAAGDSEFDISMVNEADYGLVPYEFKMNFDAKSKAEEMSGRNVFSEELLEECLKICRSK